MKKRGRRQTLPPIKKKRHPGQEHEPTEETKNQVTELLQAGIDQEVVARCLSITAKTLRKHYREILDTGKAASLGQVAGYLFKNAKRGNVAAQIFIMKTQAGWSEHQADPVAAQRESVINVNVKVKPADVADTTDSREKTG
jgi:DNA-binding NarL/FixJ family response regulator